MIDDFSDWRIRRQEGLKARKEKVDRMLSLKVRNSWIQRVEKKIRRTETSIKNRARRDFPDLPEVIISDCMS